MDDDWEGTGSNGDDINDAEPRAQGENGSSSNPSHQLNNTVTEGGTRVDMVREDRNGSTEGRRNGVGHNDDRGQNRGNNATQSNRNLRERAQASKTLKQKRIEFQKAIQEQEEIYSRCEADIEEVPKLRRKLEEQVALYKDKQEELERVTKEKDEKLVKRGNTIETLKEIDNEKKRMFEKQTADIESYKQKLVKREEDIDVLEQKAKERVAALEAEHELELAKKTKANEVQQEAQLASLKKKLEDDLEKQRASIQGDLTSVQTENRTLKSKINGYIRQIEEKGVELAKAKEDYKDQHYINDSLKGKNEKLEMNLKAMEDEFGLISQPIEF